LDTQESLRKRMSADVAHELRTPLATLQSHMEAMIDGIWEPDISRLKSCHEEIMRIGRMIGDLENLARFEGENLHLEKTEFELSQWAQAIVQNFEGDFQAKGVSIRLKASEQRVFADRDKLSQILVNLLSNALKYTDSGGMTEVCIQGDESIAELVVQDTGIGIPEEDLPYIFERFYRADKSRNRLTGGSGIGLTIAKSLVEAHNGTLSVESIFEKGTTLTVRIPKNME